MKLYSPAFERALRRRIKSAVRQSPALRREARRAGRGYGAIGAIWIWRLLTGVVLWFLVTQLSLGTRDPATGMAVITLWLLGSMSVTVQRLFQELYASPHLPALVLLPIPATRIFRWSMENFARRSLFSLFDLLCGFGALGVIGGVSVGGWVALALVAVLAWVTMMAAAILCAARWPGVPYGMVNGVLYGFLMVFLIGNSMVSPVLRGALEAAAFEVNLLIPLGWPVALCRLFIGEFHWWPLALVIPTLLLVATLPDSIRRLSGGFSFYEVVMPPAEDLDPSETDESDDVPQSEPKRLGPTAVEEKVRASQFLTKPPAPRSGWLEGWLWFWLNKRERALMNFVFPRGCALTGPWLGIAATFAITAALGWLAAHLGPRWMWGVLSVGMFAMSSQILACFAQHGGAFTTLWSNGVNIPLYAVYGIGFWELSRLLFKRALLQVPLLVVASVACAGAAAWFGRWPMDQALQIGLKLACLLAASWFLFVTLAFSKGTNDTSRFGWGPLVLLGLMVGSGLVFLGLGFVAVVSEGGMAWGACAAATAVSIFIFTVYGLFYNFGRVDLLNRQTGR